MTKLIHEKNFVASYGFSVENKSLNSNQITATKDATKERGIIIIRIYRFVFTNSPTRKKKCTYTPFVETYNNYTYLPSLNFKHVYCSQCKLVCRFETCF